MYEGKILRNQKLFEKSACWVVNFWRFRGLVSPPQAPRFQTMSPTPPAPQAMLPTPHRQRISRLSYHFYHPSDTSLILCLRCFIAFLQFMHVFDSNVIKYSFEIGQWVCNMNAHPWFYSFLNKYRKCFFYLGIFLLLWANFTFASILYRGFPLEVMSNQILVKLKRN